MEAIARRVAELLRPTPTDVGWVRAELGCRQFGVSSAWVYAHANELGAIRLGTGPKARLRFDLERCRTAIEGMARSAPRSKPRRPRKVRALILSDSVELIRGRSGR